MYSQKKIINENLKKTESNKLIVKLKHKPLNPNLIKFIDYLIDSGNNPLDNKFMIIDEVHRLVSQIINGSLWP